MENHIVPPKWEPGKGYRRNRFIGNIEYRCSSVSRVSTNVAGRFAYRVYLQCHLKDKYNKYCRCHANFTSPIWPDTPNSVTNMKILGDHTCWRATGSTALADKITDEDSPVNTEIALVPIPDPIVVSPTVVESQLFASSLDRIQHFLQELSSDQKLNLLMSQISVLINECAKSQKEIDSLQSKTDLLREDLVRLLKPRDAYPDIEKETRSDYINESGTKPCKTHSHIASVYAAGPPNCMQLPSDHNNAKTIENHVENASVHTEERPAVKRPRITIMI